MTGLQLKTNDGLEKSGRIHASPPLYHTQQCKLIANHGGPLWGMHRVRWGWIKWPFTSYTYNKEVGWACLSILPWGEQKGGGGKNCTDLPMWILNSQSSSVEVKWWPKVQHPFLKFYILGRGNYWKHLYDVQMIVNVIKILLFKLQAVWEQEFLSRAFPLTGELSNKFLCEKSLSVKVFTKTSL